MTWPWAESVIILFAAGAIAWLLASGWSRGLRFLWAAGWDRRCRLAHSVAPVRLVLAIIVVLLTLSPIQTHGPGNAATAMAVIAVIALVVATTYLRDALAGIALSVRRPFTLHDQIQVGDLTGEVVDLGLTRVRLATPSGAIVDLPARRVASARVTVGGSRGHALPVELVVPGPAGGADPDYIDALRDEVYLSTYTDAAAPVVVELIGGGREVRLLATPVMPDERAALRSDIAERARALATTGRRADVHLATAL